MKRGQFGTRTIWHRSEKGTIWHRDVIRIRNAISRLERNTLSNGREILCQIFGNPHFKSTPGREKTSSFALFKQYGRTSFPTQRPKGAQTPSNCHIFPKCWQFISNTSIHIRKCTFLTRNIPQPCARRAHRNPPNDVHSPNVGRIYPIPINKLN